MAGQRYIHTNKDSENPLAASHYGPRDFETKLPAQYASSQGDKVQVIRFAYDTLPDALAADDSILKIPANSYIVSASLTVITAGAGGTAYAIGLNQTDGTTVDADGVFNTTELALANLTPAGDVINAAAGAQIGTTVATDVVVEVTATGTFTAGEYQLEVVYRTLDDRASF